MPERLELTRNAQFYKPNKKITDQLISLMLETASSNMEKGCNFLLDETRIVRGKGSSKYKYSVRVFPSVRDVYFFDDDVQDRVHAFILILEIDGYVALFRKSAANINQILNDYFVAVNHDQLTATLNDDAEFQKLSARVMTLSDKALRAKSYEASDLKGLLSTHAAGRSIPFFLKVRQGVSVKTLNAGTGRVVENSERSKIDHVALWAKQQIALIKNPLGNSDFLSSFARKIDLEDVLNVSDPKAIMFETGALFDLFNDKDIEIRYQGKRNREKILLKNRARSTLLKALEVVAELDISGVAQEKGNDLRLKKTNKGLSFTSKRLSKYRVVEGVNDFTLPNYIISHGWFSVCFSDPKYMYFLGSCFEDKSGVSEIDSILKIFQPKAELNSIASEKGSFKAASKKFSATSMFCAVEDMHKNDDYIFCDDLGDEWADHITLNRERSEICFIHSKHGEVTRSATKFQDVVGQGIKNLGNMFFDANDLVRKNNNTFSKCYKAHKGPQTNISRIRRGRPDRLESFLIEFLQSYNLRRKCILSCSFVSKNVIESEFQKIKSGNGKVTGNIIQLLWIISSFAHACREMNVEPVIYCKK